MKNILAVYRKELSLYFVSPVAYGVIGFFLAVAGFFFARILGVIIQRTFMMSMQSQQFGGPPPEFDVPGLVMQNFFGVVSTIILFAVPFMTMGTYAEEKRRGTMELLMTSPLGDLHIVLGKFLATLTLFLAMLAPTLLHQSVLFMYADSRPSFRILASAYLGVLLLGAMLIAIGQFISSLTESQIIAASAAFGLFLILWVIDAGLESPSSTTGEVLQYLAILRHFDDFTKGVIDTKSLVYYLSFTALGIFMTLRSVDSLRWRKA